MTNGTKGKRSGKPPGNKNPTIASSEETLTPQQEPIYENIERVDIQTTLDEIDKAYEMLNLCMENKINL